MTGIYEQDVVYSELARSIRKGRYRHYKGGIAVVIDVAVHSETLEEFVVYTHENKDGVLMTWVRPITMFLEVISVNGESIPRFEYIGA
jgi:hypothetical protein